MSLANKNRKQSGQILVLMALMSTTLIILFGMVLGVGHLVQAKMNLQNAVDMASMAGASQQARYLNQISLINYRMRQNYKFILYDLYLTQSRFNKSLKDEIFASSDPFKRLDSSTTAFGICQQQRGFCGGAIGDSPGCISDTTDICQNVGAAYKAIPPIMPSPVVSINPILIAVNASIVQLGQAAVQFCQQSQNQNSVYAKYIFDQYENRQRFQMQNIVSVLREFNQLFSTSDTVTPSQGKGDGVIYQTFFENLISANQQPGVKLEWLMPSKNRMYEDSNISQLPTTIFNKQDPPGTFTDYFDRQRVSFKVRYIDFRTVGTGCQPVPVDFEYQGAGGAGTFLGLSRSRTSPTDSGPVKTPFAVALKATVKPNLLFWPQEFTPTLVAVGGSKPFGSRIGPSALQTAVETIGQPLNNGAGLANMSFYPGDNPRDVESGKLAGVGHVYILRKLIEQLSNADSGRNDLRPSMNNSPDCNSATPDFMCLILAPTLYEGFFWNAFPYAQGGIESAFAKVFPGAEGAALSEVFPREGVFNDTDFNVASPLYALPDRGGVGELPQWHSTTYIGDRTAFSNAGKPAFFADASSALSSWSPAIDPTNFNLGDIKKFGRMGYSIKLVSLGQICKEITDGGGSAAPPLSGFCDAGQGVFH